MASVSWDKTLRKWDAIEKGWAHETIELLSNGLCVVFKLDGQEVAVATLYGQITIFDVKTASQVASIQGRNDLGRTYTDLITAKKSAEANPNQTSTAMASVSWDKTLRIWNGLAKSYWPLRQSSC